MRAAFRERARAAISDERLQLALDRNADRRLGAREAAFASLPDEAGVRSAARAIRQEVVSHLDDYLSEFTRRASENGWIVHRAADAEEAQAVVLDVCRQSGARIVAKSKSMVSEEIELNTTLEAAGLRVVESDLGEFIVQLRGEPPAHIITPAIHLSREDVGALLARELGLPMTTDIEVMTAAVRRWMRDVFLSADVGISGANFGVADSGTVCLVTNEGNGRMVTSLPPVHIALMGIERLAPTLDDLAVLLRVLPRSATGQKLTSYVSLLRAPRGPNDPDGPRERHLVLIDHGRAGLARTRMQEALLCIRCGACLNACPVYREIGGHAYGSVYPGPIGSVVSPGLFGAREFGHLAKASSLCGACEEACPVGVRLPELLLYTRDEYVRSVPQPAWMRWAVRAYAWAVVNPGRYRLAQFAGHLVTRLTPRRNEWVTRLPRPLGDWSRSRDFPAFAWPPFRDRFERRRMRPPEAGAALARQDTAAKLAVAPASAEGLPEHFTRELLAVGGELIRCSPDDAPARALEILQRLGVTSLLVSDPGDPVLGAIHALCRRDGIALVMPHIPSEASGIRAAALEQASAAGAGLTGVQAALAETGTLVLANAPDRPLTTSLLPPVHLAVVRAENLYPDLEAWLDDDGRAEFESASAVVLITGPSRTADIEMTLTTGVHGPRKVIVLYLG